MRKVQALVARERAETSEDGFENVLAIEDVELADPGEGEILVEIMAAGLCHSDLSVLTGVRPRPLPMVLGHEAAGVVREVGPGVKRIQPGDHVVLVFVPACGRCRWCIDDRPALCVPGNAANRDGSLTTGTKPFRDANGCTLNQHLGVSGFSQFTVVAEESAVPVVTEIDFVQLAVFGCAVLTGVGSVVNTARVTPGDSVAVFGCGGVGLAAIMGARAAGAARIFAVDVVPERLALARDVGADDAILWTEDVAAEIRAATSGGVDHAIEAAGTIVTVRTAYASTGIGGKTVIAGLAGPGDRLEIVPAEMVGSERQIIASYMGSAVPSRDIPRFLELFEGGRLPLDLLIGGTYTLAEVGLALAALTGGHVGRQIFDLRKD